MKTVAIYSMKGGVGKTATAVNLAYCASKSGNFTLICDLDPQAASTYYFRIKASRNFNAGKFIKGGKNIVKNIKGTDFINLDLLPSKLSYRNFDLALDALKNSTQKLKTIFKDVEDDYDYLFLDCPPGISLISENVFNASDVILVPLIPTTLSVRTYIKLLKFFKLFNRIVGLQFEVKPNSAATGIENKFRSDHWSDHSSRVKSGSCQIRCNHACLFIGSCQVKSSKLSSG